MTDSDAALGQKIFHITQTQAEPEVQPHSIFDDFSAGFFVCGGL